MKGWWFKIFRVVGVLSLSGFAAMMATQLYVLTRLPPGYQHENMDNLMQTGVASVVAAVAAFMIWKAKDTPPK